MPVVGGEEDGLEGRPLGIVVRLEERVAVVVLARGRHADEEEVAHGRTPAAEEAGWGGQ